jgi:formylglycine-generating enzyme required for sulfatase activity
MPHADGRQFRERVGSWRAYVMQVARSAPRTRIVFSCRSLDYSEPLSTPDGPVPHVRIEQLDDAQVERFLSLCAGERGTALWRRLRDTPQRELFRSPFFLKLLVEHAGGDEDLPAGRAALFTGFVRHALEREIVAGNPRFEPGALIEERDRERIVQRTWRDPFDLPRRSPIIQAVERLAYGMQKHRAGSDTSALRVPYEKVEEIFEARLPDDVLRGGIDLQLLEDDRVREEISFVHQLVQEYFAGRVFAATVDRDPQVVTRVRTPWRAIDMTPSLADVLASLANADPLPTAPRTGWEETVLMAGAVMPSTEKLVTALREVNLPLAGHCLAQAEVAASTETRTAVQNALAERIASEQADLRARIAAARALAELGDPRFRKSTGAAGSGLVPPMVPVSAGHYRIGRDGSADGWAARTVELACFSLAKFPVTNAEWRMFMDAGGYERDEWWQTTAAKRWRRGEGTADWARKTWRQRRTWCRDNLEQIRVLQREGRLTSIQADDRERITRMDELEFESWLREKFPDGRLTRPGWWNDSTFNHPALPVVGICWFEANAYCAWLSAVGALRARLPTEVEWEAAARGSDGRAFAFGDVFDPARCNTFESHVRATTPVGVYPGGETPGGIADLTGTVWEWTASTHGTGSAPTEGDAEALDEAGALRVMRGGSWDDPRDLALAWHRMGQPSSYRLADFGFRIACDGPT